MEVSFPVDVKVKEPALCALIDTCPGVPPVVARLNKMMLEVVQALVVTVTAPGVPLIAAVVPTESLAAVVAWMTNLFPALPNTKFPFVAVIAPDVAVNVVVAAMLPGAMNVEGIDRVTAPAEVLAVIWLAVPATDTILPADDEISSH